MTYFPTYWPHLLKFSVSKSRRLKKHTESIYHLSDGGSGCVNIRVFRAAVLCLVLLCVLLLTATKPFRDELLTKITNLTEERDELIIKNKNLLNNFYYMSNETKNWTESRQDCLKKGADLIIINNSTEHDFVKNNTVNREFWIGVTDIDVEDRWKWVDGSNLTSGGGIKEPGGGTTENCAVTYLKDHPNLLGWHDVKCNDAYQGICEKSILPLLQP
uniref:Zmp:0000000924 n=1 Tax=Cyprinus carpio TaxID=7962 RepID=A0A8C1TQ78_CYPCA